MNPTLKAFGQLIKFRLTSSVAATSVFGYLLGCKLNSDNSFTELFDWWVFTGVLIGGMLVVFASNGLNQIIEKENDGKMDRTSGRPIVEERITLSQAILFCWITGIAGILLLSLTVPFVAVFLSGLSLAIYVFVYTPMKQTSNIAVMIGAIPGALPPLIGYTAVVGRIDDPGMMLFLVQFFWQFPHFWAIAWMLHDDYQKAGYWMLPTSGGRDKKGAYQIMIYTVLLIIVSMTPIYYGMSGPRALILILPISLWVLYKSYGLFKTLEVKEARKLLYATLIYTPVVFMAYILF